MYLLTTVSISQNKSRTYIQLRDKHMRLLVFFPADRLNEILKNENLSSYQKTIEKVILTAKPGTLYQINKS